MDHRYIEEHHIVDRFLMGHLDTDEAERFQDHTMSCSECLDNLALSEKLQQGMRDAFAGEAGRTASGWRVRRGPWVMQSWLSAAAVVVMAVTAGLLGLRLNRVNTTLEDTRHRLSEHEVLLERMEDRLTEATLPRANVPLYRMSPERSVALPTREPTWLISLAGEPQWLVLVLHTEWPGGGPYEGRIFKAGESPIWQESGLLADGTGDVTIGLLSSDLPPGDYHLVLEQQQAARPVNTIARYYFRVSNDGR